MKSPNFFIIGAPKCGTTALSSYLREHPNVFMSTPKEPHYFAFDLPGYRAVHSEQEYLDLFRDASEQHLRVGEASVFYLYSKSAATEIRKFAPDACIIIMVRNPLELVASLHSQLVYTRDEEEGDFCKAWSLKESRKVGAQIPKMCQDAKLLHYDHVARLGAQIEYWQRFFPQEQLKIIFFEDFAADTEQVYRDVIQFLGLPADLRQSFPRVNENKRHRFGALGDFTEKSSPTLIRVALQCKKILGIERWGVLDAIRRFNTVRTPRRELDVCVKRELIEAYRDDIMRLSNLTGRNLNRWLDVQ